MGISIQITSKHVDGFTIVEVSGGLDVYRADKLRSMLTKAIDDGAHHLVIDLNGLDFLDSIGVGVLVGTLKKVRLHDGSLRLVCSQDRLLRRFTSTGLTKVFRIYDSQADALAGR